MTPSPWSISNRATLESRVGYLVSHDDGHVALVFSLEDARAVAALHEAREALADLVDQVLGALEATDISTAAARLALSKLEGKA